MGPMGHRSSSNPLFNFFLFQGLCEPIALISQGCAAAEKVHLHLGPSRGLIVCLSRKAWGFSCIQVVAWLHVYQKSLRGLSCTWGRTCTHSRRTSQASPAWPGWPWWLALWLAARAPPARPGPIIFPVIFPIIFSVFFPIIFSVIFPIIFSVNFPIIFSVILPIIFSIILQNHFLISANIFPIILFK